MLNVTVAMLFVFSLFVLAPPLLIQIFTTRVMQCFLLFSFRFVTGFACPNGEGRTSQNHTLVLLSGREGWRGRGRHGWRRAMVDLFSSLWSSAYTVGLGRQCSFALLSDQYASLAVCHSMLSHRKQKAKNKTLQKLSNSIPIPSLVWTAEGKWMVAGKRTL